VQQENHLRVNTDLNELIRVLSWFDSFYQSEIPKEVWLQCQTALAEGLTNAIRHAHKNQPLATPIDIALSISVNALDIRIWDHGPPFNFANQLAQSSDAVEVHKAGGRGLQILRSVADQLSYSRTEDNRNCLLIVKQYRITKV